MHVIITIIIILHTIQLLPTLQMNEASTSYNLYQYNIHHGIKVIRLHCAKNMKNVHTCVAATLHPRHSYKSKISTRSVTPTFPVTHRMDLDGIITLFSGFQLEQSQKLQ